MDPYIVPQPGGLTHRGSMPVLLAGLASSALTLFLVWLVNQSTDDFNPMGLYGYYIIPIGAMLVGVVAGCGYGIGSWVTGARISKALLWSVVGLQLLAYFAAQFLEYRALMDDLGAGAEPIDFFTFFDVTTRAISFKEQGGGTGEPLGAWGYGVRFLELAGFVFGGLVVPLILKAKPYCEGCQVYMRTRHLGLLPLGIEPRKIKKGDATAQAEAAAEQAKAASEGTRCLADLRAHAQAGQSDAFKEILDHHREHQKRYAKVSPRVALGLSLCPRCFNGFLSAVSLTGQGKQITRSDLGRSPVTPGFGREMIGWRGR